ncbi:MULTISPECIES: creatininase family protein [unclassified Mesorhizobium]|uniref:creatininase family protein n=1 Tax=unclassified Mesorhizobium TaxID=325217 RepID=UPI000F74FB4F|nr:MULTISPECIES: creatininase family protein [unclassified Mesorhizobium]TGT59354.1 creatininase family protein [Mesorhizobium sp. M00.F.Ca.ET.170.01.1.1]AZO12361.1 creatininase family protein [Mesorhizobium sp. M3A.F.Ca.ET.080.04.2.1]RWB69471.1 MAG: creatininase family protein [Mesorhizobium sp.]RWB85752.1 MAG: creatininase family protein [Mesorhizobium sp.]RWE20716.1 MAG: creatininase family protein [Mesorhizobium sp.]
MTTGRVWWGDYRTTEYASIDPEATIAVLPLAAIEQHGPHLPVSTDTSIMMGMLETVIARLPDDLDIRILPVQAVGKSNEHLHAPGTLTLPAATLVDAWTELGLSVARAGVRKLIVVNSHGGNEEIMGITTRELRVRAKMLAVKTSWQRFGRPAGMYTELEDRHGIHGGDVETSLMLHFRPDLVDMGKADNFVSNVGRAEKQFALLRHTGTHAFAWIASDLNPNGVVGDAGIATAEKGRLTAEHQADGFIDLVRDVRKAKLADWLL